MKLSLSGATLCATLLLIVSSCQKNLKQPDATSTKTAPPATPSVIPAAYPGLTGEVVTLQGKDTLHFIKKADGYVFQGDIMLSPEAFQKLSRQSSNKTVAKTFNNSYSKLWPGGQIPYAIEDALAPFSPAELNSINTAIQLWNNSGSHITIVPRTNQANYVAISPGAIGSGYSSTSIGMAGGRQAISLELPNSNNNFQDFDYTTVLHEFGHHIGLFHEQSRADRNFWIHINLNNLNPNNASTVYQFETYTDMNLAGFQLEGFDFESIMLYGSYAFSNGNPVMTRLDGSTWGQGYYLSAGDIQTVSFMYSPHAYARVEYVQTNYSYNNYGQGYDEYETDDCYLKIYSDASYTTPLNLPNNVAFHVSDDNTTYYDNNNSIYTHTDNVVQVPAGQNSVYLGNYTITQVTNDLGIYRAGSFTESVYLARGVGYITY
ncbi:MAG: hypothetical protein JST68_02100 [Bacteroidetes bacterium]|nr:hypothetical protein [Bacteroidota bacterium]